MEKLNYEEKITLEIILKDRIETLEHEKQSTLNDLKALSSSQDPNYLECCNLRIIIIDKQLAETKNLLDKLVY